MTLRCDKLAYHRRLIHFPDNETIDTATLFLLLVLCICARLVPGMLDQPDPDTIG